MAIIRLQGDFERQNRLYYEFDSSDKPLGEGGMGKVYKGKCVNEGTGMFKEVAIKFMFSDLPAHAIERCRREASIRLRNDNLIEMLGFIETRERNVVGEVTKRYHVVSELLDGVMLDDLLQGKISDHEGNLVPFAEKLYQEYRNNPFQFAVTVIRSLLSGLMALHDAGYIHRDIDPTNIMVTRKGHIKLIDFGIAKPINTLTTHDKALTTAGVFMGKPWYAAPELVLGDVKHQNATTDIYAVGILFYQLYSGLRPFDGPNHEVLNMQLHKRIPLKNIPRKDVRAIIAKATNKKQDLRYQSASEFRVDIDKLSITPVSHPSFVFPIIGGIGVLTAVIIAVWWFLSTPKEDNVDTVIENDQTYTYNVAVEKLKSSSTANEGVSALDSLSQQGDYNATYLLSRLKFDAKTKKEFDNIPDSIWGLQLSSHIQPDYKEAHDLLKKAVSMNPNDCNSLYALGFDYLVGDRMTFEGRKINESKRCLNKALELAKKNNNQAIIHSVEKLFEEYADDFKK